jgi:hypothetical protein
MNRIRTILFALMLLTSISCGSHNGLETNAPQVSGIYGSTASGVTADYHSDLLKLSFSKVPAEGQFISVALSGSTHLTTAVWGCDESVLHLAVPIDSKIEIGVYPLADYNGTPVQVVFDLTIMRHPSIPPIGLQNSVDDLSITELPADMVRLEWTEKNTGDYNVDGKVTIQDITPIGMFFSLDASSSSWNTAQVADGNGDGVINIADLAPIGMNYRSEIAGYNIKHAVAGTPVPIPVVAQVNRVDFQQPPLPPHYSIELPGAFNDEWAVSPFDHDGVEGSGSDGVVVDRIDVRNSISYAGSDLWNIYDGSSNGILGTDSYIMRIVAPGDWPSRTPIVPGMEGQLGVMLFDGLPRQQWLMADFVIAPTVNPVDGSSTLYTDQWIVSVPFELPSADRQLQLDTAITLTPRAPAGYYIDFNVTQTVLDTSQSLFSRLDPLNYLVASDTSNNGVFIDEAWLRDSDRDCVSDALLDRQNDYNSYDVHGAGMAEPVLIKATAGDYSVKFGLLELNDSFEDRSSSGEPDWRPILEPVTMRFTERTNFALVHNYGDPDNQYETDFNPEEITSGDELLFYGYRLIGPTGLGYQHKYWADRILKKVSP